MRLLLDTHSLIWFFSGHPKLSDAARELMENPKHKKLISIASIWEMAIKKSKQKLILNDSIENYINRKIQLKDFDLLPITLKHLEYVSQLHFYHKDPFDRLIIAQSIAENLPILSRDLAFDDYGVNRIWDNN